MKDTYNLLGDGIQQLCRVFAVVTTFGYEQLAVLTPFIERSPPGQVP